MITKECRKPKEAYKIAIMATLMAGIVCLAINFYFIIKTVKKQRTGIRTKIIRQRSSRSGYP